MRSQIIGTGHYLPKKVITNDDLAKVLDTSDEWITTRTGIKQRHISDPKSGETNSYMGEMAARQALDMANLSPKDIDFIITATCSSDYRLPNASCLIQERLQASGVPSLDISAACAGSIYGLNLADCFIRAGQCKNVLVIATETLSSVLDWQDRNTAVLFGDGSSACVVTANHQDDSGFLGIDLYADGTQSKNIWIPAGGSLNPIDEEAIKNRQDKIHMNGRETFKFAVRALCDSIDVILNKHNLTASDIKFAVPHQANLRIIDAIAQRINLPTERFLINLDRCANTSAASLLLAYDEANRNGRLTKGDLVLMLAIGAGFAWGVGLYRV